MVVNGISLLQAAPIKNMLDCKVKQHGVSHGLAEVGYDIRLKQEVRFYQDRFGLNRVAINNYNDTKLIGGRGQTGRFCIASAIEEFQMPRNLVGIVHDKSTWARKGLSVFNTVIEPGFFGGLTLELVYHGMEELHIPAGAGIAQVIFHSTCQPASYNGKYQFQSTNPEPARSG